MVVRKYGGLDSAVRKKKNRVCTNGMEICKMVYDEYDGGTCAKMRAGLTTARDGCFKSV